MEDRRDRGRRNVSEPSSWKNDFLAIPAFGLAQPLSLGLGLGLGIRL